MEDTPGRVVGDRYTLLEVAGRGGMATVWRALMRGAAGFERQVALKRIHPELAMDREFVRMFAEEARLGSQILHPNVVQVLDFGVDELGHYLVLEWVDGIDLERWVRTHTAAAEGTPWHLVAGITIEVLKGLGAMHGRLLPDGSPAPVFHRDVGPRNILLGLSGLAKLSDLGLARAMDRARFTQPNVIKGRLSYLAPELTRGRDPSVQSDVFAVGVTMWEGLAGRRVFDGKTDRDVMLLVREGHVPPLADVRPDIPEALAAVVARAAARMPSARYDSTAEMASALADILRSDGSRTEAGVLGASVAAACQQIHSDEEGDFVDSDPVILLDRPRSNGDG